MKYKLRLKIVSEDWIMIYGKISRVHTWPVDLLSCDGWILLKFYQYCSNRYLDKLAPRIAAQIHVSVKRLDYNLIEKENDL